MNGNAALLATAGALLLLFAMPLVFIYRQMHRRPASGRSQLKERWRDSRLDVAQDEFELYQILPGDDHGKTKLTIRDEKGGTRAEIVLHSRDRADIRIGEMLLSAFDQTSPPGHGSYAGLVGGIADCSIVIRDGDRVLSELIPDPQKSRQRFSWNGETYTVDERMTSIRDQITIVRDKDERVVGQFASQDWAGLSQARYVAIRRNFDPLVALWLCYLATVTSCRWRESLGSSLATTDSRH